MSRQIEALKWTDIKSDTMTPDAYLKRFQDKEEIISNYENYVPSGKVIGKIDKLLNKKDFRVKIFVIGASWCKDCVKHVPHLIKILETLKTDRITLDILYGVKVNAFHKKNEIKWHKEDSPPEAVDPKFDVVAIPIFYLFDEEGNFKDRIVEGPEHKKTLEEELLYIIKKSF